MLYAHLFGGLALTWHDEPVPRIPGHTARSLLAYLLTYRNRPHTRDLLAGTFWPDLPDAVARRRLSQVLWRIRKAFDPHPILLTAGDTIQINRDLPLWLDVEEFTRRKAQGGNEVAATIEHCELSIEHYRGEFLAGYYEDWLIPEREQLREQFLDALERLVAGYKRQGDYVAALTHARRLANEDSLREEAHREVMRLCHLLGRDVEALRQFEICRRVLAEELNVEPSPATLALAHEISERGGQDVQLDLPQVPPPPAAFFLDSLQVPELPLVGREAERAEILTHVEALLQGLGGVVLLEGEAGVGKTRLLRAIARDAEWRGAEVLWGSGRQVEAAEPYGPLVESLSGGLSPLRARQLAQVVDEIWLQVLTGLLPPLAAALPDLCPPPALDPAQERDRLVNALAQLLAGWAQVVPVLLVIEDMHWVGQDALDLLARLVPLLSESGVLVLGSYRSEEVHARPEIWQKLRALDRAGVRQRLVLKRLSAGATGKLVRRSLGMGSPAPLFEARLFDETAGNPLFLLETLRALYGEGLLFRDENGQWSTPWDDLSSDYAELPLPQVVEQIIARRLDSLTLSLRKTMNLAAVLGERFDFDLLRTAGGEEPSELLASLRALVQGRFLDETEQDYRFHHDKIRQVAYGGIAAADRPRLHHLAAQAWELLQPQQAAALAHHWTEAGVWGKAAAYHQKAGGRAQGVYANAEATAHYTQALEALDQLPASPDLTLTLELLLAREAVHGLQGERKSQALDLAAAQGLAEQLDEAQQARVALRQARYCVDISDYPSAREHLNQVVKWARAANDRGCEATGLGLLGDVHLRRGDGAGARSYAEQVLAIHRSLGDRQGEAQSLGACGIACYVAGDLLAAQQHNEQALDLYRALGDRQGEGLSLYRLGRFWRDLGRLAASREYLTQALEITRLMGDRYYEAYYRLELGNLYYALGVYARARESLGHAAKIFGQIDEPRGEGASLMDLGLVYLAQGEHEVAQSHCEQGRDLLRAVGDTWTEAASYNYLGRILEGRGNLQDAAAAFDQALDINREADQPARTMRDLAGLARISLAQGRLPAALERVQEILSWISVQGIAGIDYPLVVYLTIYRVLAAAGDMEQARKVLSEAHALLMERADKLDDEELRRSFLENVAEHRAILAAGHKQFSRSITARLPLAEAPTGRPLRDDEYLTITWTVVALEDSAFCKGPARRQARLERLMREAADQGAAPTVGDLAAALAVSEATVRRDLTTLRRAGHPVQTRGSRGR